MNDFKTKQFLYLTSSHVNIVSTVEWLVSCVLCRNFNLNTIMVQLVLLSNKRIHLSQYSLLLSILICSKFYVDSE